MKPGERWCSRGAHYLPEEKFGRKQNGKFNGWCFACKAEYSREWRANRLSNPALAKQYKARCKVSNDKYRKNNKERKRERDRLAKAELRAKGVSGKEACKRWRENYPDRARESNSKYWQRLKADPERHLAHLESRRMGYRLRKMQEGIQPRNSTISNHPRDPQVRVPSAPLAEFLQSVRREYDITIKEMGITAGMNPDKLRHIMNGQYENVQLSTVDKCVTYFNGPPLQVMYPDLCL